MRITHVTDCYLPRIGGIELQVNEIAHRQALAGHDVHVVTASPSDQDGDAYPPWVHRLCPAGPAQVGFSPYRRVGELIGMIGPDVVHVHASVLSPLATAAAIHAARTSRPTVVTVHSLWAYLSTPYRLAARATRLAALPIEWTAVSACAAEQVRGVIGADRQVGVVPNGIDADYWRQTARAERREEVCVAAVMRLSARKRPLAVLAALRRARSQLPAGVGLRAVILGDGPQRGLMNAYLRAHRMQD
ncbi:MAG: glycosyltransferase family 4 protein, partial [bacterium]